MKDPLLESFRRQVERDTLKKKERTIEALQDSLPLILRALALILASGAILDPYMALFLVYPVTDIILQFLKEKHGSSVSNPGSVKVADLSEEN